MPIRMVKDPKKGGDNRDNYPGQRDTKRKTGGSNALGAILGVLFAIVMKKPKIAIPIIIVVVLFFVFGGGKSGCSSMLSEDPQSSLLSLGCEMDEEVYDQASVFEPLADNVKNPLPERISLEDYCPTPLNQGKQGSCVGWGSSYAARTILHSKAKNINPDNVAFSPSYLYNQIALTGCQGSYIFKAMDVMQSGGVLPMSEFAYTERSCNTTPDQYQKRRASDYKIKGYNRLTYSGDNYRTDMLAIKQNLAQGAPVVIGMMVGGSFLRGMVGKEMWKPTRQDYDMAGFGGHCMCVIGYDDYKDGGAFQIMNSWGTQWGKDGIGWVRYKDFDYFTKEAYGLFPMGSGDKMNTNKLSAEFGLINNNDNKAIPLQFKGDITYSTTRPISKGTTFKIEVTNSIECYTYLFGQETDGSSYVLFPYTQKHSPYCGITGTRLFPKDYSLQADELGNKDYMAILVTKKPIDYNKVNQLINSSQGRSYGSKVLQALRSELVEDIKFGMKRDNIYFECALNGNNAVAVVLEIDKR